MQGETWIGSPGHEHARPHDPTMTRRHNEACYARERARCPECDSAIVRVGVRMVCTQCEWGWPWERK